MLHLKGTNKIATGKCRKNPSRVVCNEVEDRYKTIVGNWRWRAMY